MTYLAKMLSSNKRFTFSFADPLQHIILLKGGVMTTPVCPHCGFEVEDEEMCRACGALIEDIPVRDVSLTPGISGFFTALKNKGFHGTATSCIGDPGAAPFFFDEEITKLHE